MSTIKQRHAPDIPNIPYLTHPIKSDYNVSEGYIYSSFETSIHGNYFHKAIDYACLYQTPVYAAASGYAVASYHRYPVLNEDKTFKLLDNKPQGNGLGYFIQIFHPEKICKAPGGRITQYGHLSKFAEGIYAKTFKPIKINFREEILRKNKTFKKNRKTDRELDMLVRRTEYIRKKYPWTEKMYGFRFNQDIRKKESYLYTLEELEYLHSQRNRFVKWVEQGELIGFTGTSAIIHGDLTYRENSKRPNVKEFDTWDECHLHFEEASRNPETFVKEKQRDPYGIYLSKDHYKTIRHKTLFMDDIQGKLSLE